MKAGNMSVEKVICSMLGLMVGQVCFANEVEIVGAKAKKTGDTWTIAVTLNHEDVDRDHYADIWRVVTKEGKVLGTRELGHPHKDQPFTRDLKKVVIPEGMAIVYIEAHDKVHGWTDHKFKLKLAGASNSTKKKGK